MTTHGTGRSAVLAGPVWRALGQAGVGPGPGSSPGAGQAHRSLHRADRDPTDHPGSGGAEWKRTSVGNDNPFLESLFRTVKYRSEYPTDPFESLEATRKRIDRFVDWYNNRHQHSGIKFVTPSERRRGLDGQILKSRAIVCTAARARHHLRREAPFAACCCSADNRASTPAITRVSNGPSVRSAQVRFPHRPPRRSSRHHQTGSG